MCATHASTHVTQLVARPGHRHCRVGEKDGLQPDLAGVAQSVEHVLGKDGVTGSIPVSSSESMHDRYHRHIGLPRWAGEHVLGKDGVAGSIPAVGSVGRPGYEQRGG